jgi:hypothetical protein
MLQEPGKLSEETLVTTWVKDLTVDGVWNPKTKKRLICAHTTQRT